MPIIEQQPHATSYFQLLLLFITIFGFIFSPRLYFGFIIHIGFLSVTFFIILVAIQQHNFYLPKPLFLLAIFFISLALYHLSFATFFENDPIHFISICITTIVNIVFGWIVGAFLFDKGMRSSDLIDRLIMLCALAVFTNSCIIIIEYQIPEIKILLETFLFNPENANINYAEHNFRFRGVAASGGSALSNINALSVLFFIFLVINRRISGFFALFCSLVITISNVFVARTGLIFCLLFFIALFMVVLYQNLRSGIYGHILIIALILLTSFSLEYLLNFDIDREAFEWAFEWTSVFQSGRLETASTDDLFTMLFLPDNIWHLIFGIGFFEGDFAFVYSRSDSGYIKTILSIGIFLSIILYTVISFIFFTICKVSKKYLWLVISILIFMLILEIKEPVFYQNYSARVMFLLSGASLFILSKQSRNRIC